MPQLVPTVRTTPTMTQYAHALLLAWPEATKEQAGVLYAQFGIETGGGQSCWNWNLGNVKHVNGDGHDWMALRGVWEIINGKRVELPPENPGAWFKAYPSLDEAMVDHFAFLKKHFASAWPAVELGNPSEFAHQLKVHGYYTAPEQDYINGMKAWFTRWMASAAFADAKALIDDENPQRVSHTIETDEPIQVIHPDVEFEPRKYDWEDETKPSDT